VARQHGAAARGARRDRHAGVAIYEGDANAFATGAFKNSALVAVSTGLLQSMTREEVEAVLGHEVGHVANGDMVTLTLIQGVVNTFVVFLSRVVGYVVDRAVFKTERGVGPGYMITVIVCQIVFGIAASVIVAWFSRQREFRADAASATYLNNARPMINALRGSAGCSPARCPSPSRHRGSPGAAALPRSSRATRRSSSASPPSKEAGARLRRCR
jgi:heat shock protein HtpX